MYTCSIHNADTLSDLKEDFKFNLVLVLANWKAEEKLAVELHASAKRETKLDRLFRLHSCNYWNRLLNIF
jgi:hypothetical protein